MEFGVPLNPEHESFPFLADRFDDAVLGHRLYGQIVAQTADGLMVDAVDPALRLSGVDAPQAAVFGQLDGMIQAVVQHGIDMKRRLG
jgi:endonuclease YncB( thermonuclease family)